MVRSAGHGALTLLTALQLIFLPVLVRPCGHHVVHGDIKSLVRMHLNHQAAHPLSGAWGPRVLRAARAAAGKAGGSGGEAAEDYDDVVAGQAAAATAATVKGVLPVADLGQADISNAKLGNSHRHADGHDHDQEHGGAPRHDWQKFAVGHASASGPSDIGADGVDARDLEEQDGARGLYDSWQEDDIATLERRRRLQQSASVPDPAPLRLSVTYQLGALDASQRQHVSRMVQAVSRILRKFILVKRPSTGGLLADPYCVETNGWRCTLYYPDYTGSSRSTALCGNATILPQHVVSPFNCTFRSSLSTVLSLASGSAGPASGAGSGASAYGTGCSSYMGTQGDATDMYLYITAVQNEDCDAGAAAWARPCLLDLGNNRPLVGTANVCPGALRLLDEDTLTAVLTHEMIHALGFTDSMFNLTRNPDGSPRPLSDVVSTRVLPGGRRVSHLITPAVRDAARSHFNCSPLAGAQLEEEGSEGSAGSHWEYNHYQGEVMVASTIFAADGSPPALSNLTLSFLEDTGWYVANRSAAGLLRWAAGSGCALPLSASCRQYMAAVPDQTLFCDPTTARASDGSPSFRCSNDYKATGVCRSLNFTGGCGLLLSNNAQQTCIGPDAADDMPDVFGWGTGSPSGRCVPVVYRFQAQAGNGRYIYPATNRDGDADAACFDTACSADGTKAYVKLFGQQFLCPAGKYLSLPELLPGRYLAGRIGPCPSAQALCSTQSCPASSCNPMGGDCLNGVCHCHLEYTGASCSLNLITGQAVLDVTGNSSSSIETGTGGGSASSSPSPSPPPSAVWTQVVQLTISLYNNRAEVLVRSAAYASVLATWSELDLEDVRIASITVPLGAGNDSSSTNLSSPGQQAGEAFDGTIIEGRRHRQRRHVLQTTSVSSLPPMPMPSPSPSLAPPAAESVVTALLTAGGSRATTILVARLRDSTQQAQLQAALTSAGFSAVPGSLSVQTLITQVMGTASPSTASSGVALAVEDDSSASGKMVIIIAIAAGAAALAGIIAAVVAAYMIRARRARQQQGAAVDAAEAFPRPERFAAYLDAPAGRAGGGSGDGNGESHLYTATAPAASPSPYQRGLQGYPAGDAPRWPGAGSAACGGPVVGSAAIGSAAGMATTDSAPAVPQPDAVAYRYYSALAAALGAPSVTSPRAPVQPPAYPLPSPTTGFPAPLYSGPIYGGNHQ